MEKVEPDNFNVKYGGFGRVSWQVRWEGGQLVWRRFDPEWTEVASAEIQPEPQQWIDFWKALDTSRIWDWNEVYYRSAQRIQVPDDSHKLESPEETDEVTSWAVEILLKDGRLIDSSGSNAVPGETRRARRGRGRRRGGRNQGPQSNRKPQEQPQAPPADAEEVSTQVQEEGDNLGIPSDTFDQFIAAVQILIGGKEFAEEQPPEALFTQFRTRTVERTDRPDPFAEEEKSSSGRSKRRKRVRKPGGRSSSSTSRTEGSSTRKKRSRRGKRRTEGTVEAAAGETGQPKKRRRRRRKKAGSGAGAAGQAPTDKNRSTQGEATSGQGAGQGDGTQRKKRRRRRRRRKPGGGGDSGGASPAPSGG